MAGFEPSCTQIRGTLRLPFLRANPHQNRKHACGRIKELLQRVGSLLEGFPLVVLG